MRHKNSGRKFDRNTSSRRAMLRNLTANSILHERIETTDAKAKELRRVAERLITKARRLGEVAYTAQDELSAGRQGAPPPARSASSRPTSRASACASRRAAAPTRVDLVEKVLLDLAKRYASRAGRLHAHREVRPAPRRQRPDLAHRAGGRRRGRGGRRGQGSGQAHHPGVLQDGDSRGADAGCEGRMRRERERTELPEAGRLAR